MIKKMIVLSVILFAFQLVSCKSNENTIKDEFSKKPQDVTENIETKNDEVINHEQNSIKKKPETVEEIIEFANELKVDTSMTAFSLEKILEDAQPKLSEDGGDDYQNETAYLGDSVTLGLSFFKNHPSEMVIAKGSINPMDAVDKKLIELPDKTMVNFPDALKLTGAKRAVLTFGSNAISVMSEETFLKYYIKLIDAIEETTPDCKIIIQSITPLATTCTLKKLTNTLVNRSNLLLLVLAYSRDLYFLDSTSQMKDENGYLKIEFCSSDDGIHINEKGYEVWIDMLRRHVVE
ncbi:MAG: hypothetical protein E7582_05215 [Ruminococcaceae bacterium]|nr:hypothetical protein [Oscillospiraceae bacterium]